MEDITYHSHT